MIPIRSKLTPILRIFRRGWILLISWGEFVGNAQARIRWNFAVDDHLVFERKTLNLVGYTFARIKNYAKRGNEKYADI